MKGDEEVAQLDYLNYYELKFDGRLYITGGNNISDHEIYIKVSSNGLAVEFD